MEFWKMNGAGNDFIILEDLQERLTEQELSRLAKALCQRHMSIGADGLMAVKGPVRGGDLRMLFFNSDGSLGEMCGNGARCICRYAYERGLAGEEQTVETTAGIVTGRRIDRRQYKIRLNDPTTVDLDRTVEAGGRTWQCAYVELGNPGLPHAVVEYPDLREAEEDQLRELGRALRWSPAFPKGANVNFYQMMGDGYFYERTFERGVEDFTYACGTGTASVATVLALRDQGEHFQADMAGGTLHVDVELQEGQVTSLYLTGPTNIVCKGQVTDEEALV